MLATVDVNFSMFARRTLLYACYVGAHFSMPARCRLLCAYQVVYITPCLPSVYFSMLARCTFLYAC
jgi:hypothetical protein